MGPCSDIFSCFVFFVEKGGKKAYVFYYYYVMADLIDVIVLFSFFVFCLSFRVKFFSSTSDVAYLQKTQIWQLAQQKTSIWSMKDKIVHAIHQTW